MTYHLGIDLGTTYTGAARVRDGRAEIITLGDRAAVVPSVLFVREDGDVLTGDPAIRRGISDPTRVAREFKRRVGDPTPMMVGATPFSADALMGELLESTMEAVAEREGELPACVGITHPANWGPYKQDILRQAMRMAEVGPSVMLTEPEAAAIHFASTERIEPGQVIAVYDLGGGTFDAAVLRKTATERGFEILGESEGIERLGGIDFDEAVFQHVLRFVGGAVSELDPDEAATVQAVARLRSECVDAKEALSSDTDVSIPVFLPTVQTEVRVTRAEFEAMIRPPIGRTLEALRRALRSSSTEPDDLASVLLVGGSSRIPLVAQMVSAELGRPIAVDVHPKHSIALGAAIAAAQLGDGQVREVRAPAGRVVDASEPARVTARPTPHNVIDLRSGVTTADTEAGREDAPTRLVQVGARPGSDLEHTQVLPVAPNSEPFKPVTVEKPQGIEQTAAPVAPESAAEAPRAAGPPPAPPARRSRAPFVAAFGGLVVLVAAIALRPGSDPVTSTTAETTVVSSVAATTVPAVTASTAPSTTSVTLAARAPEHLQVVELPPDDPDGGLAVRTAPGIASTQVRVLPSLTTFTTTGRVESVDGVEWLEVSEPVNGWVSSEFAQAVEPGPRVEITGITVDGEGRYAVTYQANYEPQIGSGDALHIHFYFDTVGIDQAGHPGHGPWILYDVPSPFTGYTPSDRPEGAAQMCATPANSMHEVLNQRIFHCFDLPDA